MLKRYRIVRTERTRFKAQVWSLRHGWRDLTAFAKDTIEEAQDVIKRASEAYKNLVVWKGWR